MTTDARSLPQPAQEILRIKAVRAVRNGMKQREAARLFGVHHVTLSRWVVAARTKGMRRLKAKKRGRPAQSMRLKPWQCAQVARLIVHKCPDQLRLPFTLWTREAVQQLIQREFGIRISVWTIGRYLKRWGFTPQKPMRRAYERDEKKVQQWLKEEYPRIRKEAKKTGAEIHWGDEMGVRSDHQAGRSYGRKGQTPTIPGTGQRFRCNMLSTITNRGTLRFMLYTGKFTAPLFMRFLGRLIRQTDQPIFLIVDRHPVHRSAKVRNWLEQHRKDIRMFFLPGYSPDLNPDELLNNDVKSNAIGRKRPGTLREMEGNMRSHLRCRQKNPESVKRYFHHKNVRYAA